MSNTDFLYKVYRNSRVTQYQRVQDGNFEGWDDSSFLAKYQSVGTPTSLYRNRLQSYSNDALLYNIVLDGVTNSIDISSVGQVGTKNPVIIYTSAFTFGFWFNKANWNTAVVQYLLDHLDVSNEGFRLYLDGTNLRAQVNLNGTLQSATYALASIAAGDHFIAFGSDGQFIRLWIDGSNVATYNAGSVVGIRDTRATGVRLGAELDSIGYASGTIGNVTFFNKLISNAEALQMFTSKNFLGGINTKLNLDFSEGSGTSIQPSVGSIVGAGVGGVINGAPNWILSDKQFYRSVMMVSNTGGSAQQGIEQTSGYKCIVSGGAQYTASVYVKAPVGEQIRLYQTPTGGGSASFGLVVATGDWQPIAHTFTTNALATSVTLKVSMESANASVKTMYVDKLALNDGAVPFDYFDQDTEGSGSTVYSFNDAIKSHVRQANTSAYVATWRNVISDFKYDYEINSAGAVLPVVLARKATNTGEDYDLQFALEVRVTQFDENNPAGFTAFTGTIQNYTVNEDSDTIEVQVVSTGAELANYPVTTGEKLLYSQPSYSTDLTSAFWGNWHTQTITPLVTTDLGKVNIKLRVPSGSINGLSMSLYKGDPSLDTLDVITGFATVNVNGANTFVKSASTTSVINNTTFQTFSFDFTGTKLAANTQYYFAIYTDQFTSATLIIATNAAGDVGAISPPFGRAYSALGTINNSSFGTLLLSTNPAWFMEVYQPYGSTTVNYLSIDPSDIMRKILDAYQGAGGLLTYDATTLKSTNTLVSYKFVSVTVFDAMKKCLELAPAGWYFYIDQAEKKVYFKKRSDTPDHRFIIGKHFTKLSYEKRTEDIINAINFIGGDLGGYNLYKEYEHTASIALYGRKLQIYSDNRVKLVATADLIANTILEQKSYPQIRIPFTALNNYRIDTVKPGDVITFRNTDGAPNTLSQWDIGFWDDMYWDFDIKNPSTYQLQIVRFGRDGDTLMATLSTLPPDVSKRVEDINRNLEKQQTLNNPDEPI